MVVRSGSYNPAQGNKAVREASTAQRLSRCESSCRGGNPAQAAESGTLSDGEPTPEHQLRGICTPGNPRSV